MYLGESLAWGLSKPEVASQRNLEEMSFVIHWRHSVLSSFTFLQVQLQDSIVGNSCTLSLNFTLRPDQNHSHIKYVEFDY